MDEESWSDALIGGAEDSISLGLDWLRRQMGLGDSSAPATTNPTIPTNTWASLFTPGKVILGLVALGGVIYIARKL